MTGQIIGGIEGNMNGAFIVWRGAQMKEEWL